jgi:uncharacterized protein with ATP-grasp and redox domains
MVRQAREAIALTQVNGERSFEVIQDVLSLMSKLDWRLPPPVQGQQVHRLIRERTGCSDPYAAIKAKMNQQALDSYHIWQRQFRRSFEPLQAAARLAIIGNLWDVGAKTQMDQAGVLVAFEQALTAPLCGSIEEFARAVRQAQSILYLADNAGEIVFDRDLLSQLPLGHLTVAVRGKPVLNDATLADAKVAGLFDLCEVISNGSDAPGTLLQDCSLRFRTRFETADLVIAKGQGNYESLAGCKHPNIFFLLKAKCGVLSEALGVPVGSLVIHRQTPPHADAACDGAQSTSLKNPDFTYEYRN